MQAPWDGSPTGAQRRRLERWLVGVGRLAVVECGAGTAVPTVRLSGEMLAARAGATLIRINVREPDGPPGAISIAAGAREALIHIDVALGTHATAGADRR